MKRKIFAALNDARDQFHAWLQHPSLYAQLVILALLCLAMHQSITLSYLAKTHQSNGSVVRLAAP